MGFFDSLILSALADQPNLTELECQKEIEAIKKHQLEKEKKVKKEYDKKHRYRGEKESKQEKR